MLAMLRPLPATLSGGIYMAAILWGLMQPLADHSAPIHEHEYAVLFATAFVLGMAIAQVLYRSWMFRPEGLRPAPRTSTTK